MNTLTEQQKKDIAAIVNNLSIELGKVPTTLSQHQVNLTNLQNLHTFVTQTLDEKDALAAKLAAAEVPAAPAAEIPPA
jgi:hypothetical protein